MRDWSADTAIIKSSHSHPGDGPLSGLCPVVVTAANPHGQGMMGDLTGA
jgi:hypothetical protein